MYNITSFIKQAIYYFAYLIHRNKDSKVVYYHDVGKKYTNMGTDFSLVKNHVQIIRESGYEIVPSISKQKKQVMICFDDGWAGIYDYKEFFVEQKIYPTIFIAVDLIGSKGHLTKQQIRELQTIGFRFQGHTWSHHDLTGYSEAELEKELKDSKVWLENEFHHTFDAICYPMGRFSQLIFEKCKEFNYTELFSSIPGGYYDLKNKGLICRICAQFSSANEFKWMLNSTSWFFRRKLYHQQFKK